ncbi:MAG: cytochrome o ubiquinol oxidase subunit IV [Burkholderiales bacterium]|nr:cytochrome o ubiquinol oxidase subunit IV [Burkholderiales bacterium]
MSNYPVDHAEIHGTGHGTLKSYIIGFILSIALTIIPYALVVHHLLSGDALIIAVVLLGIVQLLVQLIFFLHLSANKAQRWNSMTFAFTVLIIFLLVVGSLWIMWNLNYNMMDHM